MADTDRSAGASRALLTELRKLVQQAADGACDLTTSATQLAPAGPAPVSTRLPPTTNNSHVGYGTGPKTGSAAAGDHYTLQVAHGQTARANSSDSQVPVRSYSETGTEADQ